MLTKSEVIGMEEALPPAGELGVTQHLLEPLLHIGSTGARCGAELNGQLDRHVDRANNLKVITGQAPGRQGIEQGAAQLRGQTFCAAGIDR